MEPLPELEPELLARLDAFAAPVLAAIARQRSRRLAAIYTRGLLGPAPRKNVEQLARQARGVAAAPAFERDLRAMLSDDDWRHQAVMWGGAHRLLDATTGWQAYTLDDTALLKQGDASVGVANQYAGCVGGLANSQVLVSLGVAQEHASAPLAMQLFLPAAWDRDVARRAACHVPPTARHRAKWQLAQDLLAEAAAWGLPRWPLLADSLYGDVVALRRWLDARAWPYVVGVNLKTALWPAGLTFVPRPSPVGAGRRAVRLRPDRACASQQLRAFAKALPPAVWQTVHWRDGSRGAQRGRFAAVRVRPARGWQTGGIRAEDLQAECWLLVHWPDGEAAPTKAWLSNLPPDTPRAALIALARLRWRVERDYREGKGLVGLDHYEGRTWHGLHHHAALVTLAQQFLASERLTALRAVSLPPASPAPSPPAPSPPAPSLAPRPPAAPPPAAFSP